MLTIFKGIFDSDLSNVISISDFLICVVSSLILGLIMALSYMYKTRYTKSFIITLALLPSVVCIVIMMVNGNVGAGVAVAGAFSLVRFRSVPGTAKEIATLFLAMSTGLILGMGYIGYATLFTIIMCLMLIIYTHFSFGVKKNMESHKILTITIPEDLNYTNIFDDIFEEYTSYHELLKVKTTNLGSLFRITYNITLKNINNEKEMIDKLRCRNGNLEISISIQDTTSSEL